MKQPLHWRKPMQRHALGIAAESPQRSEDLERKARAEGNAVA